MKLPPILRSLGLAGRNVGTGAARVLLWAIYGLSRLSVRRENVCVFGGGFDAFSNGKHLAIHLKQNAPGLQVSWITHRRADTARIREAGIPAYYKWSPAGMWHTVRARWVFLNSYAFDVNFWLTGGAIRVNLWHGVPLKKLGFDITNGPLARLFQARGIRRLFYRLLSSAYQQPHLMISTSVEMQELFARAFRLPAERCPPLGYPRTDLFSWDREALITFVRQREPNEVRRIVGRAEDAACVWAYLPTWRDSRRDFIAQSRIDWMTLDDICRESNAFFLVKFHPLTPVDVTRFQGLQNVCLVGKTLDVYPLLPFVDSLITDYSSVFFDYLLLDRPIVFFPFDLQDYVRDSRDLYFAYDDVTPGPKATTEQELYEFVRTGPPSGWDLERGALRRRIWDQADGSSAPRILRFLMEFHPPLTRALADPH